MLAMCLRAHPDIFMRRKDVYDDFKVSELGALLGRDLSHWVGGSRRPTASDGAGGAASEITQ